MKGGDKNSLALLSSKRTRAYSRTWADEAFALPSFSDDLPVPPMEPRQQHLGRSQSHAEHNIPSKGKTWLEEEVTAQVQHGQEYGSVPASEPHGSVSGSQNARQTMLQHESVFKEQVPELHRTYQKQCLLMAEMEQKGPSPLEPPSSLPSTGTCWAPEERNLGDASAMKAVGNKPDNCALTSQIGLAGPCGIESKNQEQQKGCPVLQLEHFAAASHRPSLDLELPGEDYMYIEEKRSGMYRAVDASIACMPEKRSDNPELSFNSYHDVRAANSSSNVNAFDRQLGQIDFFNHRQEARENLFVPLRSASMTEYIWRESPSCSMPADKPPPLFIQMETEPSHRGKALTDIEAKLLGLPGWLSQASTKGAGKALPRNLSSASQLKGEGFFTTIHDQRVSSDLESSKSPASNELLYPLLQSGLNSQQGNSPSQNISTAIIGAPHKMALDNRFKSVSIPFLCSHAWDNQGMKGQTSGASGYLTSDVRETQKTELFARHWMRASIMTSTMLPWYHQREIPPQELKQESSIERPAGVSHDTGVHKLHQSESASGCILQSSNILEMGLYRTHSFNPNGSDTGGVLPPPTRPESSWKRSTPAANPEVGWTLGLSRRENDTAREELETFFCPRQVSRADSARFLLPDLNARVDDFDLNVSVSPFLAEEEDLHGFSFEQNGRHLNAEGLREEHRTDERSSCWTGIEAQPVFEQVLIDAEFTEPMYKKKFCTETGRKAGFLCSQGDMHTDGRCGSVKDETGEQLVVGKSSVGSGLTMSESRGATKARVNLNTSSGKVCQSHESWSQGPKDDDVALSSNSQCRSSAGVARLDDKVLGVDCWSQQSVVENPSDDALPKRMQVGDGGTECGDESDFANSTFGWDSMHMAEAAELLLSLGTDMPLLDVEGDILRGAMAAGTALCREVRAEHHALEGAAEKIMDPFELAVLMLKPINPNSQCMFSKDITTAGDMAGTDLSPAHLGRRLSRRGRASSKEFHKRGALRSLLSSLSRQEIIEDLEVMEGMVESCSVRKQSCSGFKVCSSWCESARRRKQRGRRQSRWWSLPIAAVQA